MPRGPEPAMTWKPLTLKQRKAMDLLVAGYRKYQVQEELGIHPATLYRWQQLPAWGITLAEKTRIQAEEDQVELKSLVGMANRALKLLVANGNHSIQLGACRLIYETVDRLAAREQQQEVVLELESQLEDLKAAVQGQLPAAREEVIEAEITPIASPTTSPDPAEPQEAQ